MQLKVNNNYLRVFGKIILLLLFFGRKLFYVSAHTWVARIDNNLEMVVL